VTRAVTSVLLIEDNPGDARLLREMLREERATETALLHVQSMAEAEAYLAASRPDVILLDLGLPDAHALEALKRAHAAAPGVPVVVLTGFDDEAAATKALQQGAQDYLIKGQVDARGLLRALRYAIERRILEEALGREKERVRIAAAALFEAELLGQKSAADASSAAKSEFFAQMSHEIRTPMNGVLGMASLLIDTKLTADQREYAETIQSSATALLTIINDILHLSTIESGKVVLDHSPFSLRHTVSSAAKVLAVAAAQKGVELIVDIHPKVPDAFIGDATRLRQMILNLAGNAVKFTERGEVVVTVENDAAAGTVPILHFAVKDTGGGIPDDQIDRLFEAFEQLDSSDARSHGGSGLGLTITRRLAEMMGGRVWAESVAGVGSTFHLSVQFETGKNDAPVRELAGRRIFVIHNNPSFLDAARGMLEAHGAEYRTFSSCKEAEFFYGSKPAAFDDLVLDSLMLDCDGDSTIERALSRGVRPEQIILLLSAAHLGAAAQLRQRYGITRHLVKPLSEERLIEVVLGTPHAVESAVPANVVARKLRVLIAEDNLVNVRVITHLLERDGHTTVVACNGREAIDAFRRHSFDIILMDVQMPVMDGLAATRQIREMECRLGLHTPIVALTANCVDGDRDRCFEAGMDGYVSKPIRLAELRNAIAVGIMTIAGSVSPDAAVGRSGAGATA
jgi:signal transduction histidine kinase/BarA-like signal transduction histidine kinase